MVKSMQYLEVDVPSILEIDMNNEHFAPQDPKPAEESQTTHDSAQLATESEPPGKPSDNDVDEPLSAATAISEGHNPTADEQSMQSVSIPEAVVPSVTSSVVESQDDSADRDDTAEFEAALSAFSGEETGTEYDDAYRPLVRGQLVSARVVQVDKDKVFVDLGTKSEGVVPKDELSASGTQEPADVVKVGDEIKVVVLNPEGREGNPIVSKKRADFEATWDRIVADYEQGKVITAIVTERVKGGLVADVGVRGFVPGTHVGTGQVKNLDRYVGQSLLFKILEVDRDRRKVILSNRIAEEENRESKKKEVFGKVKVGDIIDGTVRRLVDYGAFVDIGGVDGLLHVSEISWSRVEHPREAIREGEEVKVMVLKIDPDSGRISLGRRQVLPDPWTEIRENYQVGQKLEATISRIVQSGAFVKLPEGAEAFIPLGEMSQKRIKKPSEVAEVGQTFEVQVIDLKPDERRMVLSIRALEPYQPPRHDDRERRGKDRGSRQDTNRSQQVSGGTTIGERLSVLKGLSQGLQEAESSSEPMENADTSFEKNDEQAAISQSEPSPESGTSETVTSEDGNP
jgi:predicted RNA-binding protein with RPS1 domain